MNTDALAQADTWVSLLTLTALEVVLGIDNVIFLSILTGKLPAAQQATARRWGLALALVFRVGLLFALAWVMGLTRPLFALAGHGFSGRDLILLGGGLFLVAKSTHEIFEKLEVPGGPQDAPRATSTFGAVLAQVIVLDLVFSLDSVITAVGMAQQVWIMITAMMVAVGLMLAFSGQVSDFVHRHPSMKVLALSFLLLIGVLLVADGMGQHLPKGYVYFAMGFSFAVELLNLRLRRAHAAVPPSAP